MLTIHSDEYYMQQAYKQALLAFESGEVPVGAVMVCNQQIIARAYNQTERLQDVTAHAEMVAITAAENAIGAKYLNECSLYVTLEPCVMCAGATYWSQLKKIVFGASDPKRGFGRLNENILHPKTQLVPGIMEVECRDLINQFFKKLRK
ncbi:nucleoside deaminase [Xanthovirga aplysinae]|uniref:nucleoside deaminase n=1 Tax=Xanthovirga aplysinae TaxID=2529853 RepID=UPI0012BBAA8A|nr:nucleoside deaminase [Xanthovirga aplysinae]MTI30955.1 nucleoside deaminase [Xanthovirga aplysinae]